MECKGFGDHNYCYESGGWDAEDRIAYLRAHELNHNTISVYTELSV